MRGSRIRNLWKRVMAVLLTGVMLAGVVPVDVLAVVLSEEDVRMLEEEQGSSDERNEEISEGEEVEEVEVEVTSTNSFGALLADMYDDETAKQEQNSGCNIFSVEVSGVLATVDFETVEDGTLVVCVYEEDGNKMLGSGSIEVVAGDKLVTVEIDIESMPDYYYLRAFLVESSSLRPFCTAYESPVYTKEMQDFLSKTADDFDSDRVLNLDEDNTNNFAVYEQEVKLPEQSQESNVVISVDEINHVYVIENPDETITSLMEGDIFSCEYGEGEILIVKVGSLMLEGNRAIITGTNTSMEEVFEYVKIDTTSELEEAVVDTSGCDDGITYEGMEDNTILPNESEVPTYGAELEGFVKKSLKYTFADVKIGDDKKNAKISGEMEASFTNSLKVYVSTSRQYVELKLDYAYTVDIGISGQAEGRICIGHLGFMPISGVIIEFSPYVVLKVSANVNLNGTLSGTIGVEISSDNGIKNITTNPNLTVEIKGEIKVYIGIALQTKLKVIADAITNGELEVEIGVEASGTLEEKIVTNDASDTQIHDCQRCLLGKVKGLGMLTVGVEFLSQKKYSASIDIEKELTDFYYSVDFGEFGWGKCPHWRYKVTIEMLDDNRLPLAGAIVNDDYQTDADGKVELYLPSGKNVLVIEEEKIGIVVRTISVYDRGNRLQMRLKKAEEADESIKVKSMSLSVNHTAAVMTDGSLYTWGKNDKGQLGDGTITDRYLPVKIMENVEMVSLAFQHSAAITKDGDLYTWGGNKLGALGNGESDLPGWYEEYHTAVNPIKVMENVQEVSLGCYSGMALTKKGEVYTWGNNGNGQLGYWKDDPRYAPIAVDGLQKILENVIEIEFGGFHAAAIKEDGSLYAWGAYPGDGTTNRYKPVKILDDVVDISLGGYHGAAITESGELYMWGDNRFGQIGDGTKDMVYSPVKIMDDVAMVTLGDYHSMAVTEDGKLYAWGYNNYGQLGDGTTVTSLKPKRIMGNVLAICEENRGSHSAIWMKDGNLYIWGNNGSGQLGNGTTINSDAPSRFVMPEIDSESLLALGANVELYERNVIQVPTEGGEITGLPVNEVYNWYVMKSGEEDEVLNPDNLLYLRQIVSDSNGTLKLEGEPVEEYENAEAFIIGMTRRDISEAEISVQDMIYNEQEQSVIVKVVYEGKVLREGIDYVVCGDYNVTDIGEYTVTIRGSGIYTGEKTVTYKVKILLPETVVYKVSFNSNGGSEVASQQVENQQCVVEPSIPIREGYDFIGWYYDGSLFDFATPITHDIVLEAKWEKIIVTVPPRPNIPEKEWIFTDVPKVPGNWKYDNVKYVYDRDIMNGIAGTTLFDPDGKLNRAMFATVLYRMAGQPDVSFKKKFSDVEDGKYYSKAIIWANNQGIVNGFSDGSYGVTTNITREQIAKMLYEYASKQGLDVSGAASIDNFTDKETVSGWAVGYMKWAVDAGMISGKPNGDDTFRLDPKGEATRAECAKMLTMFMKKYE